MKKILALILLLPLFYSCKNGKISVYEDEILILSDTLNIEQIKIETH